MPEWISRLTMRYADVQHERDRQLRYSGCDAIQNIHRLRTGAQNFQTSHVSSIPHRVSAPSHASILQGFMRLIRCTVSTVLFARRNEGRIGACCAHAPACRVLNENDVLRISMCFENFIGQWESCPKQVEKFLRLLRKVGCPARLLYGVVTLCHP